MLGGLSRPGAVTGEAVIVNDSLQTRQGLTNDMTSDVDVVQGTMEGHQ